MERVGPLGVTMTMVIERRGASLEGENESEKSEGEKSDVERWAELCERAHCCGREKQTETERRGGTKAS